MTSEPDAGARPAPSLLEQWLLEQNTGDESSRDAAASSPDESTADAAEPTANTAQPTANTVRPTADPEPDTNGEPAAAAAAAHAPLRRRPRRRRVTVVGVLGELLITAGVLVMLFLGWQLWLNSIIVGAQQQGAAEELAENWSRGGGTPTAEGPEPSDDPPPVAEAPANGEPFARMIIPRLGEDFVRVVAQGIGLDVLNSATSGIGHYPETAMPGAVGNFAVAAHRTTHGEPFKDLDDMRVGDRIYVETEDGWYVYVFQGLDYVMPTGVDVLLPVPRDQGAEATDRIITLTTCNPRFSTAERMIGYGVLDAWYPREGGAPSEIAHLMQTEES